MISAVLNLLNFSNLFWCYFYQEVEMATDCDVNSTLKQHQQQAIADKAEQCKVFDRNVSFSLSVSFTTWIDSILLGLFGNGIWPGKSNGAV